MPNNSPLLDRAREESVKKKFIIPRRGRIRLVLFCLLVGLIFWFYKNRSHSPKPATVKTQKLQKTQEEQTPPKSNARVKKIKKKARKKKTTLKRPKDLTFARIKDLLQQKPPRLTHTIDTIYFKKGAYLIHYSIDTTLQRIGREYLRRYHPKYGAVVVLDPATGRVRSLISYTNEGEELLGANLFCRSIFPAASIFKTVAAAGAVEKMGLRSRSKLRTRGRNHTLYNSQLVKELESFREVTFTEAFAYSINPVFGRIGIFKLGADGLNEYAVKFGFNESIPFELDNEKSAFVYPDSTFAVAEMASGFNQSTTLSPLFGALIAAGISQQGKIYAPTLVDSITDLATAEKVYARSRILWRMPVQKETADEVVSLMKDVARFGTARKSFRYIKKSYRFEDIDYGGKTGSIDKEGMGKVDWFIGFSRHKSDPKQHIATGIVTVHGDYWTVHSSFIGAEMMRKYIRRIQIAQKEEKDSTDSLASEVRRSDGLSYAALK